MAEPPPSEPRSTGPAPGEADPEPLPEPEAGLGPEAEPGMELEPEPSPEPEPGIELEPEPSPEPEPGMELEPELSPGPNPEASSEPGLDGDLELDRPGPVELDRARLLAARFRAAGERPYLATALYALTVIPTTRVPTMGVDRHWRCYVSPSFVAATPVEELAAVWIHEVSHLLRDHHGRADLIAPDQQRGHLLANLAQDCEINDDLLADGLPLPAGRVAPDTFDLPTGLLFEAYLRLLPVTTVVCSGEGCDKDHEGQVYDGQGHPVQVECGSGAHGHDRSWELDAGGAPSVSPVEAQAVRRHTAEAIRAHHRSRGNIPSGWQRWAEQVLEPVVDWRRVLTGAVREALAWASGAVDYRYGRPSRRAAALRGVVLPSLRRPLPKVAVVIDTSGSMGDDDLTAALAEVTGVLRGVGVHGNRVTVLSCDADVHAVRRVSSVDQVELLGGGGTDVRVGIDAALTGPEPPNVVVVLTDGYTPWPDVQHTCRIIAGLIGEAPPIPPSWIETVRITPLAVGLHDPS